jgi:DNA polymerase-1
MSQQVGNAPKLVLIDGHSLLYRAFYATRPLSTTDGRPTNAVYGFAGMLWQILEDEQPDAIVVAFDTAAPTFRHEEFTDYKAHRPETAETFYVQVPAARELVEAMESLSSRWRATRRTTCWARWRAVPAKRAIRC